MADSKNGRPFLGVFIKMGYLFTTLMFVSEQHPAISECAVLGLPDKTYGEMVSAIVVVHEHVAAKAKPEPALTLDTLQSWARERMAPYKVAYLSRSFV